MGSCNDVGICEGIRVEMLMAVHVRVMCLSSTKTNLTTLIRVWYIQIYATKLD